MKARGFTLMELLVAAAITLVLAGLLLTITTNVLARWQHAQGASTSSIEAKLVLDQLERDLQGVVMKSGGRSWLDVRLLTAAELPAHGWQVQSNAPMKPAVESLLLVPGTGVEPTISNARFGQSGVWLRVISSDYDSGAGGSVPVAVAYQVGRRAVSSNTGAPVRYALFRERMTATNTFNNALDILFTDTSPADLTQPDNADVIASNVVDFGIWLYARNNQGVMTPLFPATPSTPSLARYPIDGIPAVADVMVRILSEEGAALVQAIEEGRVAQPPGYVSSGQWWWAVVEAHSRVFTRRVELKGGVL